MRLGVAGVSRETRAALSRYVELLLRWNRSLNLISSKDEHDIWRRHIDDSLQLLPLMPPSLDRAIDLGTGAGFPGLILALVSGVPFDLIESDKRKAAFLRQAARVTGAAVQVHAVRAESTQIPPARLITARAVAPLPRLLGLAAPFLKPDGICLLLKGARVEPELTHAAAEWHMHVERIPSRTDASGCILRISELGRATPSGD